MPLARLLNTKPVWNMDWNFSFSSSAELKIPGRQRSRRRSRLQWLPREFPLVYWYWYNGIGILVLVMWYWFLVLVFGIGIAILVYCNIGIFIGAQSHLWYSTGGVLQVSRQVCAGNYTSHRSEEHPKCVQKKGFKLSLFHWKEIWIFWRRRKIGKRLWNRFEAKFETALVPWKRDPAAEAQTCSSAAWWQF